MAYLWQKRGTKRNNLVAAYIASKNLEADATLLPYDIKASIAHAQMLKKVGLVNKKEAAVLIKALKAGRFKLKASDEDCHTAIENYLIKRLGSIGKKIHTARSRNDQVLVAIRLLSKEKLALLKRELITLAETILAFAKKYEFVAMPGYTHTQQAMLSSVGQWAGSFVESLIDDFTVLQSSYTLTDQNPLGSAAGFGTGLPIDREYTTKLLGFAKTQINSLYCQNSRGKIESFIMSALAQLMMTLGKIANDLILFTSYEFNFFTVDSSLTTGSSIMPHKHNLDIMEVVRANVSVIFSYQIQIQTVAHNLISGYHKDLKISKKALIDAFEIASSSIAIVKLLFENMRPNQKRLEEILNAEIFAADEVNKLVKKGMPFREAYQKIGSALKDVKKQDARKNILGKKHLGATGNLGLKYYAATLRQLKKNLH